MKMIQKSDLSRLFAAISAEEKLYIPADNAAGKAEYKVYEEGMQLSTQLNTVRSAKDFFFPQTENMADFKVSGRNISVEIADRNEEDFTIFGVRACDAKSFQVLDNVFLGDPVDTFYQQRRLHATVVTMACGRPEETCFCTVFGIDPANPAGDVSCWETAEGYCFAANTEKGEKWLSKLEGVLSDTDAAAVEAEKAKITAITEKLPLRTLPVGEFGNGDEMMEYFNRPEWKQLSQACLGCGTCTFVCPTCQCFDIRDFDTGHGVKRTRCWDSCMYSDFTAMSAGQPRPTQVERFRQRFMHKLFYYPMKNEGLYGCVGCGRCLQKCPVSLNIAKVMNALTKTKEEN